MLDLHGFGEGAGFFGRLSFTHCIDEGLDDTVVIGNGFVGLGVICIGKLSLLWLPWLLW